jgi:hypothetical protein
VTGEILRAYVGFDFYDPAGKHSGFGRSHDILAEQASRDP